MSEPRVIGELITHERYRFVDGKLIASIVNDAIEEYEKLRGKPVERSTREKIAIQELKDVTHSAYESGSTSVMLSFGSVNLIKRMVLREGN